MTQSTLVLTWLGLLVIGCSSGSDGGTGPMPGPSSGEGALPGASESMGLGEPDANEQGDIGATCFGETREAEPVGLDLLILLDTSSSMLDPLPGQAAATVPATKWDSVRRALEAFVQSAETVDIGIGLQYFPQIEAGVPLTCNSNDQCGASGPCSNSLCVVGVIQDTDPGVDNTPVAFLRLADGGPTPCVDDAGCTGPNETCRSIIGECVVPPFIFVDMPDGGFLNMNPDPAGPLQAPVCTQQSDCGGLPGTTCDPLGVCEDLASFCTPSVACGSGGGCRELPSTCVSQTKCDAADYATPAVAVSAAPERSAALVASLAAQTPSGLTPTGPALQGALAEAQAWAVEHANRQVVTLLVTDGFPTECAPLEIPDIAALAHAAATATHPVRTFVVGVFGDMDLAGDGQAALDAVARAGGTDSARIVNTAGDVTQDFLAALDAVRTTSLGCDFSLAGQDDFGAINLDVTDASGVATRLFNVGDAAGCRADGNGWYYVNDASGVPQQLRVCSAACASLQSGTSTAALRIGCATIVR